MKFLNIFSKPKEEKREISYYNPFSGTSLPFSSIPNSYTAMNISAVYRATEIISDSIAMLPIRIRQSSKEHKNELENHPLNLVFQFKDSILGKYNFIKLLIQSVLLRGNGYAYIHRGRDGRVIGLQYLEEGDVTINYDKRKQSLYYSCSIISAKKIEPINMLHLVKNSYDGINGISVISYATRTLKLAHNTENSANSFFTNGCNLSGVLTVQGQVSDKQREDIRKSWNQAYSKGGNGLAILQGNMSYQPIQLSAADSQLLESREYNVEDIARFFGISPVLLGVLTHSSLSTVEAIQNQFLLHTLSPYITMIEEEFTRKLILPSEGDIKIDFDETALLKADKQALANYYSTLIDKGILCVNEVRNELGYSEIEGGDRHLIAYTDIDQNTINKNENNITKEEDDSNKQ